MGNQHQKMTDQRKSLKKVEMGGGAVTAVGIGDVSIALVVTKKRNQRAARVNQHQHQHQHPQQMTLKKVEMGGGAVTAVGVPYVSIALVVTKNKSESSPSVSDLVKAGLEQLKAGNTLKFSVNIKNPQAIIDEAEALKGQKTSKGEIFTL